MKIPEPIPVPTCERFTAPVVVRNPLGFHMRPATAFVMTARKFQSEVRVHKLGQDQKPANGKSPFDLLMLAASEGTELLLEVEGADAQQAGPILLELLGSPEVGAFS